MDIRALKNKQTNKKLHRTENLYNNKTGVVIKQILLATSDRHLLHRLKEE